MKIATRLILILCLTMVIGLSVSTEAAKADQPYVVEYYYKTKWGFTDEFLTLFKKNHLPVLKKQIESGRILNVKVEKPRYHATEEGRWDFRVTITFKNAAVFDLPSPEAEIIKQLYPDQVTFKKEEQRRFEILISHWDVPIVNVE
ncbi:MAG: hypothetical protein ACKVZH_14305 [Blastocatellia bacterium]